MTGAPTKAVAVADPENPGGFQHIPALDGIRGLAILLVLTFHLFWSNPNATHGFTLFIQSLWVSSYAGVNLFFTLSGFLITGILIDTRDIPHYFRTFYARRSLRIFPLYYGVIFAMLLLTKPLHMAWHGWQYFILTYSSNLVLWRHALGPQLAFFNINHFWSLQVEEQFYLVWPFLIYRIRKLENIVLFSLAACAIIFCIRVFLVLMAGHPGFQNEYLVYSPTFSCADNLLFGCALATLLRSKWRTAITRYAPWLFAFTASILLGYAIVHHGIFWLAQPGQPRNLFMPTVGFSLLGITSAAAIALTLRRASLFARFFSNTVMRFFGRYSYGLYVFHYTLSDVMTGPLRAFFNLHLGSKALSIVLAAAIVAAVSVAAALLSYHLYEKHFLHLKKYFSYDRSPKPQPQQKSTSF